MDRVVMVAAACWLSPRTATTKQSSCSLVGFSEAYSISQQCFSLKKTSIRQSKPAPAPTSEHARTHTLQRQAQAHPGECGLDGGPGRNQSHACRPRPMAWWWCCAYGPWRASSPLQTPASAVDWRRGEEAEGSRTLPRSFLPCPCMHTATTPACSALLSPTARSIDAHTYSSTAVLCCCNSDATPPPILARSSGIMHALHSHHSAAAIWDAIQARRPDQTRPCMHPSQLAPACILDAFWIPH